MQDGGIVRERLLMVEDSDSSILASPKVAAHSLSRTGHVIEKSPVSEEGAQQRFLCCVKRKDSALVQQIVYNLLSTKSLPMIHSGVDNQTSTAQQHRHVFYLPLP